MFSDEKNKINIGMAHGIPSIISFLCKVYVINQNEMAKEMLVKATNWLLKCKNIDKNSTSMFSYLVDQDDMNNSHKSSTRLAWCYGDLTIGYVIYVLGSIIKDEYYLCEGLEILNNCSTRKVEDPTTGIRDKAFCHGTSGIYYIFNKLYDNYKLDNFREIKNYWLDKTILNLNENIESFKSYSIIDGQIKYAHDYGLINGYPGIGITLLSHLNRESNEWDEIFML
jgi:hypothetical protein